MAYIRLTHLASWQYYEGAIKIYKLIEPSLAPVDRRYYMQLLGRVIVGQSAKIAFYPTLFVQFRAIHEEVSQEN